MDLHNKRVLLREAIPLPMPFTLFVDPTNWCNFKCSFCPRNGEDFHKYAGDYQHMPLSLFKKIVGDVKAFGGKLKVLRLFSLGEPLLSPHFKDIFQCAVNAELAERIELSTNGSLLSEEMAEHILETVRTYSGIFYLRVSVYSVWQEKNLKITKNPIPIEVIRENVARFKRLRDGQGMKNVEVYAKKLDTFDKENEDFLAMYGGVVDEAAIEEPINWSGAGGGELRSEIYSAEEISSMKRKTIPAVCAFPFHTMSIQSDGTVTCCCVDWSRHTTIGNVREKSLMDIWNGKTHIDFQCQQLAHRRWENPGCRHCEYVPVYEEDNLETTPPEVLVERAKRVGLLPSSG